MALDYNHDSGKLRTKNIAASIELEKVHRRIYALKLSGEANFQYTGNPSSIEYRLAFDADLRWLLKEEIWKYGASLFVNNRFIRVGGYWKASGWLNISKVWQYIRQIISVPQYPIRRICNIGTLLRVQK